MRVIGLLWSGCCRLLDGFHDLNKMIGWRYKRANAVSCELLLQSLHLDQHARVSGVNHTTYSLFRFPSIHRPYDVKTTSLSFLHPGRIIEVIENMTSYNLAVDHQMNKKRYTDFQLANCTM